MTDRIKGLTITLDADYRTDDVEEIIHAISMIKGVAHVTTHVSTIDDHMARQRVRRELRDKLQEMHMVLDTTIDRVCGS